LRFLETGGRVAFTSSRTTFRKARAAKTAKPPSRSNARLLMPPTPVGLVFLYLLGLGCRG